MTFHSGVEKYLYDQKSLGLMSYGNSEGGKEKLEEILRRTKFAGPGKKDTKIFSSERFL